MVQYLPIVLLLALAALFAAGSFLASGLLGPKRPTAAKEGPYESGIAPRREPAARFPVRFYLVAMIFIIFDIEVVFLYPFAVMAQQLSTFGLVEMASFAVVVFIAFAYLVSEGALDWGPAKRLGSRSGAPVRTISSTVRRVGRPGVQAQQRLAPGGPAAHDHDEEQHLATTSSVPATEGPAGSSEGN